MNGSSRYKNTHGRPSIVLILAFAALAVCIANGVQAADPPVTDSKARAWALVDHYSGHLIVGYNEDKRMDAGSLVKLMTLYVLFDLIQQKRLSLSEEITIDAPPVGSPGRRLFLDPGDHVTVDQLLEGMVVRSANDATLALVEHVADSEAEFVGWMNRKAQDLGLKNTNFMDATGLESNGQFSTARDISLIASALIRDFPEFYERWFGIKAFEYKGIKHYSRNALLWQSEDVDGLGTSFDRDGGYSIAASARHNGMRLISTVLGARDERHRVQTAKSLLRYGFNGYETRLLYRANAPATRIRVWMGNRSVLPVGIAEDLYVTIPRGAAAELQARLTVDDVQYAPKQRGQEVGTLNVYLGEAMISQEPLIALTDVREGNPLQKAIDRVQLWLE